MSSQLSQEQVQNRLQKTIGDYFEEATFNNFCCSFRQSKLQFKGAKDYFIAIEEKLAKKNAENLSLINRNQILQHEINVEKQKKDCDIFGISERYESIIKDLKQQIVDLEESKATVFEAAQHAHKAFETVKGSFDKIFYEVEEDDIENENSTSCEIISYKKN